MSTKEESQSSTGEATSGGPPAATNTSSSSVSKPPASNAGTTPAGAAPSPSTITESSSPSTTSTTPSTTTSKKVSYTLEDANKEIAQLISSKRIDSPSDLSALKYILKEHGSLKEKVDKLKSLLGRSAKAQREAKVDLDASQKRLSQALKEIERLNGRLDKLQSRPTHLDLLMDFETNFDKALLSVGQTGGQDTAATPAVAPQMDQEAALDNMLLQELGEAKGRIEQLESLNSGTLTRCKQLEGSIGTLQKDRDEALQTNTRLQMELRMARMEAEQATRAMQDKAASLEEMQLEIDMVTKASAKANIRAAKGQEAAHSQKTDKERVQQLESQVQALKEWALASAESKRLIQERCKILETKLKQVQGRQDTAADEDGTSSHEKLLFKKAGSMVVGAGDVGCSVIELGEHAATVDSRFVIMRWKFDSSPSELTIGFNILKGKCDTPALQKKADYLVKDRIITGGAGGEQEGAFNIDNSCTILWSNVKSWVRPRAVKFTVEIVSLK